MFQTLAIRMVSEPNSPAADFSTAETMSALLGRVAADGDREAFNALFIFFAPRIKGYLMKIGAAADLADDLAQEAMLRVWRKAKLFDPARASASTWIFAIARNLRIDAARRASRPALDGDEPTLAPEPEMLADKKIEIAARDERIKEAFGALPPAQHEVVRLHFIEDMTHSEIAEHLGLALGTVKSRLRLAFEKIRKDLGDAVE